MAISSRNDDAKANSIDAEVNVSFKPGDENDGDAAESEKSVSPAAAYFRLWYFASPLDNVLRCIAATAAVAGGTTEPLMAIIFGNLVNVFNGSPPLSPHDFRSEVNKNTLYFVYLFVGKFCVSNMIPILLQISPMKVHICGCYAIQHHISQNGKQHPPALSQQSPPPTHRVLRQALSRFHMY